MKQESTHFLIVILLSFILVGCGIAPVQTLEPQVIVIEPEVMPSPTHNQTRQVMIVPTSTALIPVSGVAVKDSNPSISSDVVPRYTFFVELNYIDHVAAVSQEVEVQNHSAEEWNQLVFHIPANRISGIFSLQDISWADNPLTSPEYSFDPVTLTLAVCFESPLSPGEGAVLHMEYRLNVPQTSYDQWPPQGNIGYNTNIIQFGNWYPILVPYENGKGWMTWPFTEVGDPFISGIAEYDLEIQTPDDLVVASGGVQNHSPDRWRFHYDKARAISFAVSPRYQFQCDQASGVEICSYYLPEHAAAGSAVLETAKEAIAVFESYYGPYPYASLTFAEDAFFGSMEYSTFVLHSGVAYTHYDGTPNTMLIRMTAHETSHQWWYSLVGTNQVHEPWMDEGLAMFSELIFYRNRYPELENWFWGSLVNVYAPSGHLERDIYDFSDNQTYYHQLYRRGMMFFDDLEDAMGTDAFQVFLQELRRGYENQRLSTDDFFEILLSHSDVNLEPVMREYFPNRPWSQQTSNP